MNQDSNHLLVCSDFKVSTAGVITKIDDPDAVLYGQNLIAWLEERNIKTELNRIEPGLDILIILGGDGTLLHVAEKAAEP